MFLAFLSRESNIALSSLTALKQSRGQTHCRTGGAHDIETICLESDGLRTRLQARAGTTITPDRVFVNLSDGLWATDASVRWPLRPHFRVQLSARSSVSRALTLSPSLAKSYQVGIDTSATLSRF